MIGVLVVPFCLASINLATDPHMLNLNYHPFVNFLLGLIMLPILPFALIIAEYMTGQELTFNWTEYKTLLENYKRIRTQVSQFIKIELCIELALQITLSSLMLAFTGSETRSEQGLEAIFQDSEGIEIFGISIPPAVFIVLNMVWSLYSCWKAFVRGMSATKDHFPSTSTYILGAYVVLSVAIRCVNAMIFLAPSLGLFDLLRHYQGEKIPFETAIGTDKDELVYLPGRPLKWTWYDISRFTYISTNVTDWNGETIYDPVPPALEMYTVFSLKLCLNGFWILLIVQACVHILVKKLCNPMPFKRQSHTQIIALGMENCQIPVPMEDWDDHHRSIGSYPKAQKKVDTEIRLSILVNWIFNIIMTIPFWIFSKSNPCSVKILFTTILNLYELNIKGHHVSCRQRVLEETIGPFPQETEAYNKIRLISIVFPFVMTGAMFLQYFAYRLYNTSMHPFKVLVESYQPKTETDPATIRLIPVQRNESGNSESSQKPSNSKDPEELESPEVSGEARECQ